LFFYDVYLASPVPTSKWSKNNQSLDKDDNISTSQMPEMCKIQIKKAKRSDAGEYELELENESGKHMVPITIKVIGKFCLFLKIRQEMFKC